VVEPMKTVYID